MSAPPRKNWLYKQYYGDNLTLQEVDFLQDQAHINSASLLNRLIPFVREWQAAEKAGPVNVYQCGRELAPDSGVSAIERLADLPQSGASPLPHLHCVVVEAGFLRTTSTREFLWY